MTFSSSIRILHIEDDPAFRALVADTIGDTYEIESVGTLAKALSVLDAWAGPPDSSGKRGANRIVITDLGLPDSHGVQTFTRLRSALFQLAASGVPVLVLSGTADGRTEAEIKILGGIVATKDRISILPDLIAARAQSIVPPQLDVTAEDDAFGGDDTGVFLLDTNASALRGQQVLQDRTLRPVERAAQSAAASASAAERTIRVVTELYRRLGRVDTRVSVLEAQATDQGTDMRGLMMRIEGPGGLASIVHTGTAERSGIVARLDAMSGEVGRLANGVEAGRAEMLAAIKEERQHTLATSAEARLSRGQWLGLLGVIATGICGVIAAVLSAGG